MTVKYNSNAFLNSGLMASGSDNRLLSKDHFVGLYLLSEALILLALGIFSVAFVRQDLLFHIQYVAVTILSVVVYTSLIYVRAKSDITGLEIVDISRRLKYWAITFLFCITLAFLFKVGSEFSRLWAALTFTIGSFVIVGMHRVAKAQLMSLVRDRRVVSRAVIYGGTDRTHALIGSLTTEMPALDVLGVIDVRNSRFDEAGVLCHRGKSFAELLDIVKEAKVEAVVVDLPWSAEDRIRQVKREFEAVNVDVILAPYHASLFDDDYNIVTLGNKKTISLYARPSRGLAHLAKQVFDRVVAALLIVICAPIMILAALAIRLESSGPVLFKQPRQGFNNNPFEMLKFRSMYSDLSDVRADKLTTRDDPRVTRVGRFIRRTSIDELPQIFNVLLGQMSLVGPRPHAFGAKAGTRFYMEVVERYAARHRVLPGMTGLAQVRGHRGNTDTEAKIIDRVESDLEYIRRWTIWLDFEILLRTVIVVLNPKNAF